MPLENGSVPFRRPYPISGFFFLLLAVASLFMIGCGSSGSHRPPLATPTTVAFASNRPLDGSDTASGSSTFNIWIMNADGSAQLPLTRLTDGWGASNPVWSPDGRKLAFLSDRALDGSNGLNTNKTINLWVMNADGSGAVPLTRLTARFDGNARFAANEAVWSPDGRKLVYDSFRALDGSDATNFFQLQNIWIVNADGSGSAPVTRLTQLFTDSTLPAWSPDGRKIAFTSSRAFDGSDAPNRNATGNVWLMNADGSGAIPLTMIDASFLAGSDRLSWSPDGRKIAFTMARALDGSNALGGSNLWVMNADGSGAAPLTRLTKSIVSTLDPKWGPDGTKLAYLSSRLLDGSDNGYFDGTVNLWVVNPDGSGSAALTGFTGGKEISYPDWAPDGSRLAYVANGNIWVVNADGSGTTSLTKLTASGTFCLWPAWRP